MYYALLCYGNMMETDRWVSLYWMIKVTFSKIYILDGYLHFRRMYYPCL